MVKRILYWFPIVFLSGCIPFNEPLIEDELVRLTIECKSGETIEVEDPKTIKRVIKEINGSRREGTEEMDMALEHRATFENSKGETTSFNLYSGGKALVSGYYIHSNIEDFCGK